MCVCVVTNGLKPVIYDHGRLKGKRAVITLFINQMPPKQQQGLSKFHYHRCVRGAKKHASVALCQSFRVVFDIFPHLFHNLCLNVSKACVIFCDSSKFAAEVDNLSRTTRKLLLLSLRALESSAAAVPTVLVMGQVRGVRRFAVAVPELINEQYPCT